MRCAHSNTPCTAMETPCTIVTPIGFSLPHDRSHARAAIEVLELVLDTGEGDEPFTCGANGCDPDPPVPQLLPNPLEGYPVILTPEVAGITDLYLIVGDPEVDRLWGTAFITMAS